MHLVLVTGSRSWTDARSVYRELSAIGNRAGHAAMVVYHGDCPTGADLYADLWCSTWGVKCERRRADWAQYGKPAGNIRNTSMITEILGTGEPCECLAFLDTCRAPRCKRPRPHPSHGTADCAAKAENAGIPTQVFPPGTAE